MRKLMCLVLAISGLAMGCGSSDDDKKMTGEPSTEADAGGNGNGGDNGSESGGGNISVDGDASVGGEEDPYPECAREDTPEFPPFDGQVTFTEADLKACQDKCQNDQACYTEENCPGLDSFDSCFSSKFIGCVTANEKSPCRTEWETYICCSNDADCSSATTQEQFDACIDMNCNQYIGELQSCFQGAAMGGSREGTTCRNNAQRDCIAPAPGMAVSKKGARISSTFVSKLVSRLHR